MITIDQLTVEEAEGLDKGWLSDYARMELEAAGPLLSLVLAQSQYIWIGTREGRRIALGGLICEGLIGNVNLWFLLGGDIRKEDLRDGKDIGQVLLSFHPRVQTPVDVGYANGGRFALFCGFHPTPVLTEMYGRLHRIYEVSR